MFGGRIVFGVLSLVGTLVVACGGVAINDPDASPNLSHAPKKHRAAATTCDGVRSNEEPRNVPAGVDGGAWACRANADCVSANANAKWKNGRCTEARGTYCTFDQCSTDSDCGGGVCECGAGAYAPDTCLSAGNCKVDSDCGANNYCSPTYGGCGAYGGLTGYYCHTSKDQCIDDEDCSAAKGPGSYCAFDTTLSRWVCSNAMCAG